jgi:hypothetical protein
VVIKPAACAGWARPAKLMQMAAKLAVKRVALVMGLRHLARGYRAS